MTSKATDDGARLRLVEKDVDRHDREIKAVQSSADTALRGVVRLTKSVEGLARPAPAAAPSSESGEGEPIPCWLTIDNQEQAQQILAELVEWLEAVYLRYPGGEQNPGAYLTDCWLWHPSVVEELLACRGAWYAAYEGERVSARAVADWHDRDRPGTARRVKDELGGCSLTRHKADGPLAWRPARAAGMEMSGALVSWWAESHGDTAAPAPSEAMLADERASRTDR